MRVAITGGTGFVGRHLAERYPADDVVVVSRRTGVEIDDVDALTDAFAGVDAVAHCAGINREIGDQSFERVHVRGTAAVLEAAHRAGVQRVVLLSFLRARPGTGSPYHETKWAAEEMVRSSGLDYTVLKAGMIYGHGDHLVDHLSHTVQTVPLFASVGFREKTISPIPVAELVDVLVGALEGRLSRRTVAVRGGRGAAAQRGRAPGRTGRGSPGAGVPGAGVGAPAARTGDRVDHARAARREGAGADARRGGHRGDAAGRGAPRGPRADGPFRRRAHPGGAPAPGRLHLAGPAAAGTPMTR
ncbi:SDR family oxidoreductase [Curtobacterium oceanosedimentum]|uniref:SDR family oxidoreductase n=1 Tax=Curtobacterium oceanosedimentum TaxID=465820 RepID=UPI003391E453